jgi:methyl-accepting chemotaxis protein
MIKGIQVETNQAVTAMKRGSSEVNEGLVLADQAGKALEQIVASSANVLEMITQIATASEQQSANSKQISANVDNISLSARESSIGISEIAREADNLSRLTEGLQALVGRFVIDQTADGYLNQKSAQKHLSHTKQGKSLSAVNSKDAPKLLR